MKRFAFAWSFLGASCGAFVFSMLPFSVAVGAPAELLGGRLSTIDGVTRVVFDLSRRVSHRVFRLSRPDRLVVDLMNTRLGSSLELAPSQADPVWRVRTAARGKEAVRIVLDLRRQMRARSFTLQPDRRRSYRLVLDLVAAGAEPKRASAPARATPPLARHAVIAIDAGHGGKDPGAIGRRGTREKTVVLAIAKDLAALVDREPAMAAVLIRNGDQYLSLRERIDKARKHRADLFVSLHADAFRHARSRGASVYVLSERGASSEAARWLATRENASDLVGGVSLGDKDDQLARVLLDLSQTATLQASHDLGREILQSLKQTTRLHSARVEQAGFVVLKAPDIPSVLVETGFISNPQEERNLRSQAYQRTIAEALLAGLRQYLISNPPPGSLWAERQHVVASGDTLSGIAQRFAVSTNRLRSLNELSSDLLRVGQILRVPPALQQTAIATAEDERRYAR